MTEPKAPQDHLPKADTKKPEVERTDVGFKVTHRGVSVSIPMEALDDFEMLRDLGRMQDPGTSDPVKLSMVPAVFTRFFGDAQAASVLDALRDPQTKRVLVEVASTYLFEVFRALNPES